LRREHEQPNRTEQKQSPLLAEDSIAQGFDEAYGAGTSLEDWVAERTSEIL
jgi:hypothetical protein